MINIELKRNGIEIASASTTLQKGSGLENRLISFVSGVLGTVVRKIIAILPFNFSDLSPTAGKLIIKNGSHAYSLRNEQSPKINISARIGSYLNNRTVISGASEAWDKTRIQGGRLLQYKNIGAQEVKIYTKSGDVHACYFGVAEFKNKMKELGGEFVSISLKNKLPILQLASPVILQLDHEVECKAVLLSYDEKQPSLFEDLSDLKSFCKNLNFDLFYRDGIPVSGKKSEEKDLIVIFKFDGKKISRSKNITLKPVDEFYYLMSMLSPKSLETKGIVFNKNHDVIKRIFDKLSLESSLWSLIKIGNASYIIPNDAQWRMNQASKLESSEYEIQMTPRIEEDDKERGVILMTMNQSASYFQYSNEIFRFLLEGANVFAYDNFGKGLSRGFNSEEGLIHAIEGAYSYLKDVKHFNDHQILAKGQCAGGPPTSELGRRHPNIHVWIDQAPSSYVKMVPSLYKRYVNETFTTLEKTPIIGESVFSMMRRSISDYSLIPQLIMNILPSFDVSDNLRYNQGAQLFTIGVPDEEGRGGDDLVPLEQRDRMIEALKESSHGKYVPMAGDVHVTNWWLNSEAAQSVIAFMRENSIAQELL